MKQIRNELPGIEKKLYILKNHIKNYAWGTKGKEAFIPLLTGEEVQHEVPYAELWMGAHPNASSEIMIDGSWYALNEIISSFPSDVLGAYAAEKFDNKLPFLFKVLSAAESLSIQAHPNKNQAIELHRRDPKHYPDDNHKPEIAIALTSLTALVGFRDFSGILEKLNKYPEMYDFIGNEITGKLRNAKNLTNREISELLKLVYSTIMYRSIENQNEMKEILERIDSRIRNRTNDPDEDESLFLELHKKYGADVGLFSIFLLNLIHLQKGQGVFLSAGIPHAYIKGNIVECMANSDNVVRAGLTPKFKDVKTLVDILKYDTAPVQIMERVNNQTEAYYKTPTEEFLIKRLNIIAGGKRIERPGRKPVILLIIEGHILIHWKDNHNEKREAYKQGQSILIPALVEEYIIEAQNSVNLFIVEIPSC